MYSIYNSTTLIREAFGKNKKNIGDEQSYGLLANLIRQIKIERACVLLDSLSLNPESGSRSFQDVNASIEMWDMMLLVIATVINDNYCDEDAQRLLDLGEELFISTVDNTY